MSQVATRFITTLRLRCSHCRYNHHEMTEEKTKQSSNCTPSVALCLVYIALDFSEVLAALGEARYC